MIEQEHAHLDLTTLLVTELTPPTISWCVSSTLTDRNDQQCL